LGNSGGWAAPIHLKSFEEADGLALLEKELGANRPDQAHWPDLVRELGGLPLALHLAAGHLRTLMSVEAVLTELRAGRYALGPADAASWLGMTAADRASLAAAFGLSLTLLKRQGGAEGAAWRRGLIGLAHGPAAGVGAGLGAALAGLEEAPFRRLTAAAARLSLLTAFERQPGRPAWTLHPLLAEWLRGEDAGDADAGNGSGPFERMSQWFLDRLPESGDAAQGERWGDVHEETAGLAHWLERLPPDRRLEAARASSQFAIDTGPFLIWRAFLETMLGDALPDAVRSDVLWTVGNVAHRGGDPERALAAAEEQRALDRTRGAEGDAAMAAGLIADIASARGDLDEALRIRTEEELPVYERLGDVRELLVCRWWLATIHLKRNAGGDREEAARLLRLALAEARRLRIPEAGKIEAFMRASGIEPG
jgi:tetratricopeptide (TPR) repeat protein